MKTRILNKLTSQIICAALLIQLTGCGTLVRDNSSEKIYRGVDIDKKYASNDYLWMGSLGIIPTFFILSMPVDFVLDTLLIPIDLAIKSSPKFKEHTQSSITIPVFAVNMTNTPDFSYSIKNKRSGEELTRGITRAIPQAGRGSGMLDIVSVLTASNPSPQIDSVNIEWQTSRATPLSNGNSANILIETLTPSEDLRGAGSVIALFMPCNKVMLVNSERPFYNADFIKQAGIQENYQLLKSLADRSLCSQANQANPEIERIWKQKKGQ